MQAYTVNALQLQCTEGEVQALRAQEEVVTHVHYFYSLHRHMLKCPIVRISLIKR